MPQTLTIRDFTTDDYPGVVAVYNYMFTDQMTTVEEYADADRERDPVCKHHRWVAEINRQVVGFAHYTQYVSKYDPHHFDLVGGIAEEHQGRGIGAALYEAVIEGLTAQNPTLLRAFARSDQPHSIGFLERRGFTEFKREQASELDPVGFDPTPYRNIEARLRSEGIEIKTLSELAGDPDRDCKLYDLDWEVTRDEPGSQEDTQVDFETFVADGLNAPWRLPEGYFVAVHGEEYVGVCLLNHVVADNSVKHGITGVTRAFRRRGIALAMKVRAIEFARTGGYTVVRTDNEIGNRPMLAINERLGFVPQPGWVFFRKEITDK